MISLESVKSRRLQVIKNNLHKFIHSHKIKEIHQHVIAASLMVQ